MRGAALISQRTKTLPPAGNAFKLISGLFVMGDDDEALNAVLDQLGGFSDDENDAGPVTETSSQDFKPDILDNSPCFEEQLSAPERGRSNSLSSKSTRELRDELATMRVRMQCIEAELRVRREREAENKLKLESVNVKPSTSALKPRRMANSNEFEKKPMSVKDDVPIYDTTFGIRVLAPRIPADKFATVYAVDKQKVRLSDMKPETKLPDNAITMAVIIEKMPPKKTVSGSNFSIFRLSDLRDGSGRAAKMFLFGEAYNEHWKMSIGTVIALLGPTIMDPSKSQEKQASDLALKIDNSQRLIEIGQCRDLSFCKGRRKDGKTCTNVVNIRHGEYCDFHLSSASKRLSAAVRGAKDGGAKSVHRGSLSHTALIRTVPPLHSTVHQHVGTSKAPRAAMEARAAANLAQARIQVKTSKELKNSKLNAKLKIAETKRKQEAVTGNAVATFADFRAEMNKRKHEETAASAVKLSKSEQKAKAAALQFARTHGGITAADPKAKKPKLTTRNTTEDDASVDLVLDSVSDGAKRPKLSSGGLAAIDLSDPAVQSLLSKRSANDSHLAQLDADREKQYFSVLEAQETVEDRMAGVMEMQNVRVVSCKECDYTAAHQSSYCRSLCHSTVTHTATKRWFRCKACRNRTACYSLAPTKPCGRCASSKDAWERVAMCDEKIIDKTHDLKSRGEEQKFLNAL